ncbi:UDP-3-O-(3-hydroxymyristoyl)glucosamine N-acyltransferase [Shewanella surugensis]|uniref:UDP-3-O-acylglucosamine N-acyltransferase n=1 Tax=Shewanella surugensis TaxID=212020 RepID=A0ABT0LG42_9GAMM|nr:UDP-3-O-(3-hydroxymyristoyl)glucosamine N-acyltransferase [Shewanella surugensis]MCL1126644.1 UDP-3-O-(3-hydroxymyristoyl)glucosamine N-acyltransferase [Shewanella surugensis]
MKSYTLQVLADFLDAEIQGDAEKVISAVGTLECAQSEQITFLANIKYRVQLEKTEAGAVLLAPNDVEGYHGNAIILKDPYVGFAKVSQLLDSTPKAADSIHPSAQIDPSAMIGEGVAIGANAVIGANVILGENVQVGAGSVVGQDCVVGSGTRLWANVTLYHDVHFGTDCIVHSGAVIGSDGFGYANERGQWIKIPQVGGVRIGSRVEIGAGTTVDRGAIDHTEIHDGVIIDNQVQIAHNDIIGENSAIAGSTTLAGSVKIGKYCIIGGNCAISGHLSIVDGTHITGSTSVTNHIREPGVYSSATVAMDNKLWRKNTVRFKQLDNLFQRVKQLEKKVNVDSEP